MFTSLPKLPLAQLEFIGLVLIALNLIAALSHLLSYLCIIFFQTNLSYFNNLCFNLPRNLRTCLRPSPKHCYHQLIETVWVDGEDMSMLCKPFFNIIYIYTHTQNCYTTNSQVKAIMMIRLVLIVHVILSLLEPSDY